MIKNSFILVIPQEENKGSVEFQVLTFTNKIRRLTSHLKSYKKDFFISKRFAKNSGKTSTAIGLFVKEKCSTL